MLQYRVKLRVIRTEYVDVMAENETEAKYAAHVAFGGTDGGEVTAVSATLIAGQAQESDEFVPESVVVEGAEA